MTATDRAADAHAMAQLAARNLHLADELQKARDRRDDAIQETRRALQAAQRGNAVARAVIQKKAAQLRWERDTSNAANITALNIARIALEQAITDWQRGQK